MRFKATEVVRGFNNITYNIDGQTAVTKVLHVDVSLSAESGGKGFRTDAMRCDTQDVIKSIEHNNFPMLAELDVEQQASKGKTTLVIMGVRPLKDLSNLPPAANGPEAVAKKAA